MEYYIMTQESNAYSLIQTLVAQGYCAYYAGGWVRDHLMGLVSDDIDIATDATPEQVMALFPRTVPVGVAFGVVLVLHEGDSFEVSTFRTDGVYLDGRHPKTVEYSDAKRDAERRDFTINGMFYDPLKKEVLDYIGGAVDLQQGLIRAIGNANERFAEDRLRILRAVRFAARFSFGIEENTKKAIIKYAGSLFPSVAVERIWQELDKMSKGAHFLSALKNLKNFGILSELLPLHESCFEHLEYIPQGTALILQLLTSLSFEQALERADFFKVSGKERRLLQHFFLVKASSCQTDAQWVELYADENTQVCLQVLASFLTAEEREASQQFHAINRLRLTKHIERIRKKNPLLQAVDLIEKGVQTGPGMGVLLQEASILSINHDLHSKEDVWQILEQSDVWKKERVKETFSRASKTYGDLDSAFFGDFGKKLVSLVSIKPEDHILDVATGTGAVLFSCAEHLGDKGSIIGVDFSEDMVKICRKQVQQPNIQVKQMDAADLKFPDQSFDHVFCGFALFFFPSYEKVLSEFRRVLKPGGTLAVSVYGDSPEFTTWIKSEAEKMGAIKNLTFSAFDNHLDLEAALSDAQFIVRQVLEEKVPFIHSGIQAWWNCLWAHGTRARLEQLSDLQLTALKEKAFQKLGDGVITDIYHPIYAVATRT